jgi:hypothetical protein
LRLLGWRHAILNRQEAHDYRTAGAPDGVVVVSRWVFATAPAAWFSIRSVLAFSCEGGSATPRFCSARIVVTPTSGVPELLWVPDELFPPAAEEAEPGFAALLCDPADDGVVPGGEVVPAACPAAPG